MTCQGGFPTYWWGKGGIDKEEEDPSEYSTAACERDGGQAGDGKGPRNPRLIAAIGKAAFPLSFPGGHFWENECLPRTMLNAGDYWCFRQYAERLTVVQGQEHGEECQLRRDQELPGTVHGHDEDLVDGPPPPSLRHSGPQPQGKPEDCAVEPERRNRGLILRGLCVVARVVGGSIRVIVCNMIAREQSSLTLLLHVCLVSNGLGDKRRKPLAPAAQVRYSLLIRR